MRRRDLLKATGTGFIAAISPEAIGVAHASGQRNEDRKDLSGPVWFGVRQYGAKGDGSSNDAPAINRAIDAATAVGGGTVYFPAGVYLSYSIRLKSNICLYLDQGAVILAGPTPLPGTLTGGYDAAEPQGEWEPYQDYGHNHWHNSLFWGEDLHHISITGPGLIVSAI